MGLRERFAVTAGDHSDGEGGVVGWAFRIIFRILQFTLALTIAGIYGIDIHHARVHGEYGDSRWVRSLVTWKASYHVHGTDLVFPLLYIRSMPKLWRLSRHALVSST